MDMVATDDGSVTLGEVWRSLGEVKNDVREVKQELAAMAIMQTTLTTRVNLLDRIVYGVAGVSGSALVAGILGLLLNR